MTGTATTDGAQMPYLALAVVGVFAAIHVFGHRMRFLDGTPRSIWLSIAGGVAVSYVFLHLLPELAHHAESGEGGGFARERTLYAVSLVGLCAVYAAERLAMRHERRHEGSGAEVFALHVGSYALYSALIGYLLVHREVDSLVSLALYALAMGVHFVANDWGLRQTHPALYRRYGRWALAAAIAAGWALGIAVELTEETTAFLFAFLAGGIVMNVMKEELPEDRESRLGAFLAGAAGFSALLLIAE